MAVATCIVGGIGNQLFQYATGYALAKKNNDRFFIDISRFNYYWRPYALGNMNISAEILEVTPASKNTKISRALEYLRRLKATGGVLSTKWLQEAPNKQYVYSYPEIRYRKNIYLNGYWQNWHYFAEYREDLKKEFSPQLGGFSNNALELIRLVTAENSVAIHIRRGDYLQLDGWLVDATFYKQALDLLYKETSEKNISCYIFCEDQEFVSTLFSKTRYEYELITGKYNLTDIEEFYVMAACKHHIISNSSFSWWAAYLGEKKDSITIAPCFKQWDRDFYLPEWKCIDMN